MDFYHHWVCRNFRHSEIVECANTQHAVKLVVCEMIWIRYTEITQDECWMQACWIVDLAVEEIRARRERVEDRLARDYAATYRIDPKFRYETYRITRRRTWGQRRISFA